MHECLAWENTWIEPGRDTASNATLFEFSSISKKLHLAIAALEAERAEHAAQLAAKQNEIDARRERKIECENLNKELAALQARVAEVAKEMRAMRLGQASVEWIWGWADCLEAK